jgi:hypothetical protein
MIVFKGGEAARVVEDGREFTVAASFTAGADPRVACAKVLLNVAQLLVEAPWVPMRCGDSRRSSWRVTGRRSAQE